MSKLNKFKEWLTLEAAVKDISKKINEIITIDDLYRSALDGHIKFSVYFVNGAHGVNGGFSQGSDNQNKQAQEGFIKSDNPVHGIKGIWDLTMKGREVVIIKGLFEQSNSGVEVKESSKNGIILEQGGEFYQLYKSFDRQRIFSPEYNKSEERQREIADEPMKAWENDPCIVNPLIRIDRFSSEYVPCHKFPEEDSVLIIKTSEVTRFIDFLEETPQEDTPLHGKERISFHLLLAAALKMPSVDLNEIGIVKRIELAAESINISISNQNIRDTLDDVQSTVELKQKINAK